ncbi:hypothetical protein OG866_01620 [Streptomyces sp. NBC_00663]
MPPGTACAEWVAGTSRAHADSGGTARIAIELREWGEHSLVIVDEHPLREAAITLHDVGFDALLQLRHRTVLAQLARLCENPKPDERNVRPRTHARQPALGGHYGRRAWRRYDRTAPRR